VEARYLAAVRAAGEGALLCNRAAAHLWGIVKGRPPPPEVVGPKQRRIEGVRLSRGKRAGTVWRGIPITTVPQTLVDLAPIFALDDLSRACHEAGVKYGATPAQVKAVMGVKTPGAAKLRCVLVGDHPVTLSRLEKRFLRTLEEAGLPKPITNRPAGTRRVDCRWPEHRLTVELDSYTFHNSRHSWEQDRLREREARQRGDAFLRFTQADLSEPAAMLADITRHTRGSR